MVGASVRQQASTLVTLVHVFVASRHFVVSINAAGVTTLTTLSKVQMK